MEWWEGKRVSERENRILSLLRNTGPRGFLLCGKKDLFANFTSYTRCGEWEEAEEGKGGQRRRKEGLGWGWGGAEVLRRAIVSDRPCSCLPVFHCIRGSAASPNQFSSALHFG